MPRLRKRPRNVKIIFPSLITSFSIVFGFAALIMVASGRIEFGCYLVLAAAFLDGIDGKVARLTNAASEFGIHYDSMADLVVFGIAPAFIYYRYFLFEKGNDQLFILVPIMFLLCGAIRLARFNVTASIHGKKYFTGMPIPASAVSLCIWPPLAKWVNQDDWCLSMGWDAYFDYEHLFPLTLVLCVILSLTMISNMKCDTFEQFWFKKYRYKPLNYAIFVGIHLFILLHFIVYMSAVTGYYLIMMYGRALRDKFMRSQPVTTNPREEAEST